MSLFSFGGFTSCSLPISCAHVKAHPTDTPTAHMCAHRAQMPFCYCPLLAPCCISASRSSCQFLCVEAMRHAAEAGWRSWRGRSVMASVMSQESSLSLPCPKPHLRDQEHLSLGIKQLERGTSKGQFLEPRQGQNGSILDSQWKALNATRFLAGPSMVLSS